VETIRVLVQTLIIIVMLAVFLEMLLPQGNMRRYVRMVMGLLVIMSVLQVATGLIREGYMADVPRFLTEEAMAGGGPPLSEVMSRGTAMDEDGRARALENYRLGIQSQVLSMARLYPGITVQEALVEVEDEPDSPYLGHIKRISLVVSAGPAGEGAVSQVRPAVVEPVQVKVGSTPPVDSDGPGGGPGPEIKSTAARMARNLAEFYSLEPEKIEINYK
jgi:stage III sporulation protein AF